jgi:hypothetical protein
MGGRGEETGRGMGREGRREGRVRGDVCIHPSGGIGGAGTADAAACAADCVRPSASIRDCRCLQWGCGSI